jgi:hypothetical protein
MKNKKLIFCFLGILLLIFCYYRGKKETVRDIATLPLHKVAHFQALPQKIFVKRQFPNPQPLQPHQVQCWDIYYKELQSKCDNKCFLTRLASKDKDVFQFIQDGWFDEKKILNKGQSTMLGKFYYTLSKGDLLNGNHKIKIDESYALILFQSLINEVPQNAIFYLFKAALETKMGKVEEARNTLEEMDLNSHYFDGYLTTWVKKMRIAALSNLSDTIAGISYTSAIPMPDYQSVIRMQKILKVDLDQVGQLMVAEGLEADGELMDIKWNAVEYAVGFKFINPDKENLRWKIPTLKTFMHKYFKEIHIWDFLDLGADKAENCRMETIVNWFSRSRAGLIEELER